MTDSSSALPAWLERVRQHDRLFTVCQLLAQRERDRRTARSASLHQNHPSKTHRIVHLPSTILKDTKTVNHYSTSVAADPQNQFANRYVDISPYDRTRVVVGHEEPSGRYLNASWVRELAGGKWWIATQAPLPNTTHAFLSVIMQPISHPPSNLQPKVPITGSQSRVRTVVQLTRDIENGMRKAHAYFPPQVGESFVSPPEPGCNALPLKVTLVDVKHIDEAHCIQSTVSIQPVSPENTAATHGEPVVFKHMLYGSWPDHSVPVPEDRTALLKFIHLVDETNRDISSQPAKVRNELSPDPPIMVGCSAGVGRTGSFIALSSILRKYRFLPPPASLLKDSHSDLPPLEPSPLGPLPADLSDDLVAQEIDSLREQRPGMVQRDDQVSLIYYCLMMVFAGTSQNNANEG